MEHAPVTKPASPVSRTCLVCSTGSGNSHDETEILGTLVTLGAYCASVSAFDDTLSHTLPVSERIVGSLRPYKAAQMRVFTPRRA
jgi:hypothetical protein